MTKKKAPFKFLVLREITGHFLDAAAQDVHGTLNAVGIRCSVPEFYEGAGMLQESGLIEVSFRHAGADDEFALLRCYRITSLGKAALADALETYEF
ncbi:MAG: hypothetical protein P4L67_04525 [Candidatus Pacebacteria bacterium]|nr:hypothetical protein [Candidatus Paceibacterota bacterium]